MKGGSQQDLNLQPTVTPADHRLTTETPRTNVSVAPRPFRLFVRRLGSDR